MQRFCQNLVRNLRIIAGDPQRAVTGMVVLACLPALILNMGLGRAVVLHHHDEALHGHVVAPAVHDGHVHWHADGVTHAEHTPAPQAPAPADDHDDDGALIRGAEVTLKRNDPGAQVGTIDAHPLLSLPAIAVSAPAFVSLPPSHFDHGGMRQSPLLSLRAIVLLI